MFDAATDTYIILFLGLAMALFTRFIQEKIGNRKRIKEIQENFKKIQEGMKEATKKKDDAQIEKMLKEQEKTMPQMFEMMVLMYKPMIVIIFVYILFINPQINLFDSYLFSWPQNGSEFALIKQDYVLGKLGFDPSEAVLVYANNTTILVNSGGEEVAKFEIGGEPEQLHYYVEGGNTIKVTLKQEGGRKNVYFPDVRIANPLAVKSNFRGFEIKLPFKLPIFIQNFDNFPNWRDTFGPYGFFILSVIAWGLAISIINWAREKIMGKKKDGGEAKNKGKEATGGKGKGVEAKAGGKDVVDVKGKEAEVKEDAGNSKN